MYLKKEFSWWHFCLKTFKNGFKSHNVDNISSGRAVIRDCQKQNYNITVSTIFVENPIEPRKSHKHSGHAHKRRETNFRTGPNLELYWTFKCIFRRVELQIENGGCDDSAHCTVQVWLKLQILQSKIKAQSLSNSKTV